MRTSVVLARLRAMCPSLNQVDHALTSSAQKAYPAAFVAPARLTAQPSGLLGVHSQMTRWVYRVYVVAERKQDGTSGFGAADLLDDCLEEIRAALKGWPPEAGAAPFDLVGGEIALLEGTACWAEDYATEIELRS